MKERGRRGGGGEGGDYASKAITVFQIFSPKGARLFAGGRGVILDRSTAYIS